LDLFAGTGSMCIAILEKNTEEGNKLKYIGIQYPVKISTIANKKKYDSKSYPNITISSIFHFRLNNFLQKCNFKKDKGIAIYSNLDMNSYS